MLLFDSFHIFQCYVLLLPASNSYMPRWAQVVNFCNFNFVAVLLATRGAVNNSCKLVQILVENRRKIKLLPMLAGQL